MNRSNSFPSDSSVLILLSSIDYFLNLIAGKEVSLSSCHFSSLRSEGLSLFKVKTFGLGYIDFRLAIFACFAKRFGIIILVVRKEAYAASLFKIGVDFDFFIIFII